MASPQIPPEVLEALKKDDKGPTVIGVNVAFAGLALVCVTLRSYARLRIVRHFGLEDWFMVLSMILAIGMCICEVISVHFGQGKHCAFAGILAYCASLTFTKLSILLQYHRIFPFHELRVAIYIGMAICAAYGIESQLTGIFTCVPVEAFWTFGKPARCLNGNALYYANGGIGIATDIMVAVLPIKPIWTMRKPLKEKILLLLLLCLGIFVCIVSVVRLIALVNQAQHSSDVTYSSVGSGSWSAVEVNLAIVCGSAPALKPLVLRFVPHRASSDSGSNEEVRENRKSFIEFKGISVLPLDMALSDKTEATADVERKFARRPSQPGVIDEPSP